MSYDGTGFLWDTPAIYFSTATGVTSTPCPVTGLSTLLAIETCRTMNFNNFAYLTGANGYTDGDVETAASGGAQNSGVLELQDRAPFNLRVVVWFTVDGTVTISAPNGNCGTATLSVNTYQAVCRTGDRRVQAQIGGSGEISEVQVFAEDDLARSTAYALP